MKQLWLGLALVLISNVASAHSGMIASSIEHSLLHVLASVGITFALIVVAYFVHKHLPKAKAQRIRIRK